MDKNMIVRSWRGRGLKTRWFVEIVRWGLKLWCIARFKQIFLPEDGLPSSLNNLSMVSDILPKIPQNLTSSHTRDIYISKSLFYRAHILWNKLPYDVRSIEFPSIFKNRLLAHQWRYIDDWWLHKRECWLNISKEIRA
jgi:hypothetical protein